MIVCAVALGDCVDDLGRIPTYSEYNLWARERGAPSGTGICNICGSFVAALDLLSDDRLAA